MNSNQSIIVFYDGYCVLCNQSINWFIKHDKKNYLKFSHFKSEFTIENHNPASKIESITVKDEKNNYLTKSDAVLYVLRVIDKYFLIRVLGSLTPKIIRDKIYNIVTTNRYKWFGKNESCLIPNENLKSKFI
jgi:predicted DCC family thiol-disulfide oxidoreductase YuxK